MTLINDLEKYLKSSICENFFYFFHKFFSTVLNILGKFKGSKIQDRIFLFLQVGC